MVGSPANTKRPPGLSTRTTSRNDSSTSGMWCSTACPTTRSKASSSYGMPSASATRPSMSSPSACPLRVATLTMPGERSVTDPRRATPAWIKLSRKNPVPQPSSSARS
ncbi:Uncharacterised protein [Mycobacterium tuberculosis]|nr:Uncharacterised protein [Mycobacterium tuberculosis]